MRPKPVFTQYQKDYIEENYKTKRNKEIAKHLGLNEPMLWTYRWTNGLTVYKNKTKTKVVKMPKRSRFFNVSDKENWAIG